MRVVRDRQSNEGTIKHMEGEVVKTVEMGTDSQNSINIQEKTQSRIYRMRWWMLAVVSVTVLLATIDETILNVAIPSLQRDLGASASSLQWMVNSYMLVFGGMLLTMGAIGDRFGRAPINCAEDCASAAPTEDRANTASP